MAAVDGYIVELSGILVSSSYNVSATYDIADFTTAANDVNSIDYVMSTPSDSYNLSLLTNMPENTIYIMRANDDNYGGVGIQYRVWSVINEPDFKANKYNGEFSGSEINFSNIVVVSVTKV